MRVVAKARRAHGAGRLRVTARARALRVRGGWEPADALRAGLLDPRLPAAEAARFASPRAARELARALNPEELMPLVRDRALFARFAPALGLPVPRLAGLLGRAGGWSAVTGRPVADRDDALLFVAQELPDRVVLLPSPGRDGGRALRREGTGFVDVGGGGRALSPAQLVDELWAGAHDLFVAHEDPGPGTALRVTTFAGLGGDVRAVHAGILGPGGAFADVDVDSGTIGPARTPRLDGAGSRPARGLGEGTVVARWRDAVAVARDCATRLLPRRALMWDMTLVDGRGPLVLGADGDLGPWPSPAFGDALRAMGEGA